MNTEKILPKKDLGLTSVKLFNEYLVLVSDMFVYLTLKNSDGVSYLPNAGYYNVKKFQMRSGL